VSSQKIKKRRTRRRKRRRRRRIKRNPSSALKLFPGKLITLIHYFFRIKNDLSTMHFQCPTLCDPMGNSFTIPS